MSQSNLIAIDLAKDVFQVAIAGPRGKAFQHLRLSRTKFEQFLAAAVIVAGWAALPSAVTSTFEC